jgi:uncharacterized phiE125 gp8 family phage protein
MSLRKLVPPTVESITSQEAWAHVRANVDSLAPFDATDIALKLSAARAIAEKFTGRALARQTLLLVLDSFPSGNEEIMLPMPPAVSVTSVVYVNEDGEDDVVSASNMYLDQYQEPGFLFPADGLDWPATLDVVNAVKVTYLAGYSVPTDTDPQAYFMPPDIKAGILLILGHLYENREDTAPGTITEIPYGAECILRPHRVERGFA